MAGLVFKEKQVVFGRGRAYSTVSCLLIPVVDWQHGYGGELGIRGKKAPSMEYGADGNVAELGGSIVVANDPVG
tara:strand:+ start:327 stop:548 length:222 start_codon:yes stop_codon:yes gene_type:complete